MVMPMLGSLWPMLGWVAGGNLDHLEVEVEYNDHLPIAGLEHRMLDVVIQDVHLVSAH